MITEKGKCSMCSREELGLKSGISLSEPWIHLLQEIFNP